MMVNRLLNYTPDGN